MHRSLNLNGCGPVPKYGAPLMEDKKLDPPKVERMVHANPKYFRGAYDLEARPIAFVLRNGGLGDYINFCAALVWAAEENPHCHGHLFVAPPFLEVARHIFRKYSHWKIFDRAEFDLYFKKGTLIVNPKPGEQLINACGAHLLDLGFMYFAQMSPPIAEYNHLPQINYLISNERLIQLNFFLDAPKKYAVFTPGATQLNRMMPPKAFNKLVDFTLDLGVTPVFLGKAEINDLYRATFNEEYDYSKGIDLREKTTLLEAVSIMSGAQFVIGIDNGLLHLAGTTKVPIIFGHNVANVEHRRIRRKTGLTIDISVPQERLSCIGCQSKMRYLYGHRFSRCCYVKKEGGFDLKCLDILFGERFELWKDAIKTCLKQNRRAFSWQQK